MSENKQSVLMVHNYYQIPGGEDTVVANEKKMLEEHGHTAKIICYKKITFGSDVLIGWNTEIIDGDAHKIIDDFGERKNSDREIKIGNHVWIGANSKIMKGACIGDNSIIASNTILLSNIDLNGVIVGDLPNRILKQNINWKV